MTVEELYDSFIIKVNANAQTNNIAVDRGRFTTLYNEAANKFVEWILEKKNEDDIRYLQPLLTTSDKISKSETLKNFQLFKLPADFFDLGTISAIASSDCCSQQPMYLVEFKVENETFILNDADTKPSMEYREAPYYLHGGNVKVFTEDFKIDNISITYYRYPTHITLIDVEDPESNFKDAVFALDKKSLDRIISIAAADSDLNTNNPKYQADKLRVQNKF